MTTALSELLAERRSIDSQVTAFTGRTLTASEQRNYDRLLEVRSDLGGRIGEAITAAPVNQRALAQIQANFGARTAAVNELRSIDEAAVGRSLNDRERARTATLRAEVDEIDSRIATKLEQEVRSAEMGGATDRLLGNIMDSPVESRGLGAAVLDAGFNLRSHASVTVPLSSVEYRASTWPAAADLAKGKPFLSPLGHDRRWLWPNLVREDAGETTAVQDYRQTARALVGTVKRAVDAITDKAKVETTTTLATEALAQFAVTIDDVPNQILESLPQFLSYMASEGTFQVNKAIDDHVMAQIVAAAPPFGTTGANLVEQARNGIATMRATGANPSLLVVNPTAAASLDLLADAGGYIFAGRATAGSSNPLWGQQVVERIGAGTEPPYLIDPQMLGVLYMGTLKFEADPYTGFRKNLTTLRVEGNALFHVRQAEGARRIAAT